MRWSLLFCPDPCVLFMWLLLCRTALHCAAKGDAVEDEGSGATAGSVIATASSVNHLQCAEMLLGAGADAQAIDGHGCSALHYAAGGGSCLFEVLPVSQGCSALQCAAGEVSCQILEHVFYFEPEPSG